MSRRHLIGTTAALTFVIATVATTTAALPVGAAQAQEVVEVKDPGVTAPRVVYEKKPRYTAEAMRARIQGVVRMRAVVGTDGVPRDIEVTQSLDAEHGLDKEAVAALGEWRFTPGRKDDKAVAVRVSVDMRFTLRDPVK